MMYGTNTPRLNNSYVPSGAAQEKFCANRDCFYTHTHMCVCVCMYVYIYIYIYIYIYEGVQWKSKLQHTGRWSATAWRPQSTLLPSSSRCALIPAKEEFSSMLLFQLLFCCIKIVRLKSRNFKLHKSVSVCVVKILLVLYMPIGRDVRAINT